MGCVFKNSLFLLFLLFSVTLFGCSSNNDVYVISKEDSLFRESFKGGNGIVTVPPMGKYARNTFLVDSNSSVYFYSFQEPLDVMCGEGFEEPDTIGLRPNHIVKIPAGMERAFFKENVLDLKSKLSYRSVVVASLKDSIKNDFIRYLVRLKKDDSVKVSINIRLALPEERIVLEYKLKGEYYDPKLIDKKLLFKN